MSISQKLSCVVLITLAAALNKADGHGQMLEPPSRASAFRVGFNTPPDFNDMEAFCGGFERQWLVNRGRCGICGDAFDEQVRPHEAPGGVFATGTIVRTYTQGQVIPVTVRLTATHRGYYEFKLCPNNNVRQDPPQECFERFPLSFVDGQGATTGSKRFQLGSLLPASYQLRLELPPEVTCTQCIIQWTYVTGNRWGVCPNGTGQLGCGPQETFRACADVAITPAGGRSEVTTPPTITTATGSPVTATVSPSTMRPSSLVTTTTPRPAVTVSPVLTTTPTAATTSGAQPAGQPVAGCARWKPTTAADVPGMSDWCKNNCQIGYCPSQFCVCDQN